MHSIADKIVQIVELCKNRLVRHRTAPTEPKCLTKHKGKPIEQKFYHTIVGKAMYLTQKIKIKGINAIRELLRHLQNSGPEHWNVVKHLAGYMKKEKYFSM